MAAEENPLDTLAQVSFRIKTVGLALAFVVLLTLLFHYGDMRTQETLKFFVPVGALAGGALSVRYAWLGLRTGLEQRQRARTETKNRDGAYLRSALERPQSRETQERLAGIDRWNAGGPLWSPGAP